jgi:tRNA(Ile)-lysidine synthase
MDIALVPGRYVVAVSGGVDSVALLDLLARQSSKFQIPNSKFQFIVAHFDHGIREDSGEDRRLVQAMAQEYGLPFVYHEGKLGPDASEATARRARYDFLHEVRRAAGADAIITAHHADDVLETVILNLLRGTGRRGLSSLKSTDVIKRPLLHITKPQLQSYALANDLMWREDSTNSDEAYRRNYVRHQVLPRFGEEAREALRHIAARAAVLNREIEAELTAYLEAQPAPDTLRRPDFIQLPHAVAREVMAGWLRRNTQVELNRQLLERLVVAAKTLASGKRADVDWQYVLVVGADTMQLRER